MINVFSNFYTTSSYNCSNSKTTEFTTMSKESVFMERITKLKSEKGKNNGFITKTEYEQIIQKVKNAKNKCTGKTPDDYQRLKRYDVITVGGQEKLIYPTTEDTPTIRYYLHMDELYHEIHEAHIAIGHGGRNRMKKELQKKYRNVTIESIMTYLKLCEPCQKKLKISKKGMVVRPMVFDEMNSRCQIDLIDMQSQVDRGYKYIFVYQDHLTKFVQLRALKTKQPQEVAQVLLEIFTIFGAPCVLQSDNGREFANCVITEMCAKWDELKIVHGKPHHSQSQGSVERANQDIENMISTWLQTNNTTHWEESLPYVQLMKNRAHHMGIKTTPYEAMFGTPLKVGLKTSLPSESIASLQTEEELEALVGSKQSNTRDDNSFENTEHHECETTPKDQERQTGSSNEIGLISKRKELIRQKRSAANAGLQVQARKMVKLSEAKFPPGKLGDTVRLRLPEMHRCKTDARNILAVVTNVENHKYHLGTKYGILKGHYKRDQFDICSEKFLHLRDVPTDRTISLRVCAKEASLSEVRGSQRCNCQTKCMSDRCICKKNNVLCSSSCHSSLTCRNK